MVRAQKKDAGSKEMRFTFQFVDEVSIGTWLSPGDERDRTQLSVIASSSCAILIGPDFRELWLSAKEKRPRRSAHPQRLTGLKPALASRQETCGGRKLPRETAG